MSKPDMTREQEERMQALEAVRDCIAFVEARGGNEARLARPTLRVLRGLETSLGASGPWGDAIDLCRTLLERHDQDLAKVRALTGLVRDATLIMRDVAITKNISRAIRASADEWLIKEDEG